MQHGTMTRDFDNDYRQHAKYNICVLHKYKNHTRNAVRFIRSGDIQAREETPLIEMNVSCYPLANIDAGLKTTYSLMLY